MKVWVTKYALTEGIQEVEGEIDENYPEMFCVHGKFSRFLYGKGREWHTSKESAIEQAEKLRLRRIASLKQSLAAMEKLSFKDKEDIKHAKLCPGPVNCAIRMRFQNKPYPRSCERCGLGPCPFFNSNGSPKG